VYVTKSKLHLLSDASEFTCFYMPIFTYVNFFLQTDIRGPVPPVLNERLLILTAKVDDTIVIPCVAYANPRPHYR
jgi:hypothetical protein